MDRIVLHRRQEDALAPLLRNLSLLSQARDNALETSKIWECAIKALEILGDPNSGVQVQLRALRAKRDRQQALLIQTQADTRTTAGRFASSLQGIQETQSVLNDSEIKRLFDETILEGLFSEEIIGTLGPFDPDADVHEYYTRFRVLVDSLDQGSRAFQHGRTIARFILPQFDLFEEESRVLKMDSTTPHRHSVARLHVLHFALQGWAAALQLSLGIQYFQREAAVRELEVAYRAERETNESRVAR